MARPYIKITPIGPKTYLQVSAVVAGVDAAVRETLEDIREDLEKTVETWDDKPRFEIDGPRGGKGSVGTDSEKYKWVNDGVPPHVIDASPGMMLFRPGYRAKTARRQLMSRAGGKTNTGPWVGPRVVNHPGIAAREFTDVAAGNAQIKFIREFGQPVGVWGKFTQAIKGIVSYFGGFRP